MLKGSIVAIVTPMQSDGTIDKQSLNALVDWHIASKTDGIVVVGTTGEGSTLSDEEQFDVIREVVKQVKGRIPVVAGTGTNSTRHTIHLTEQAKKAGAVGALIVTPYYNKPPQQGLYAHYEAITKAVSFPVFLYNVPSRTACDLLPETIERIAKLPNIVGIKEASGKPERATEILKRCPQDFVVLSGEDAVAYELMQRGAQGVISVTANVAPRQMHEFCAAALAGNHDLAAKLDQSLSPLHKKLFLETNPIPTKWALHQMGLIPEGIRLPLSAFNQEFHADLKTTLEQAGLFN